MNINYGLIAILPDPHVKKQQLEILHFCGYELEPNQKDIENLHEELKTNKEFGLIDVADQLVIIPASQDVIDIYRNMIYKK